MKRKTLKLEVGAVYELPLTPDPGFAYAQGLHLCNGGEGIVMRLIEGTPEKTPASFSGATRFLFLLPVRSPAHGEFLTKVGEAVIPEDNRAFPIFRDGTPGPDGKVAVWWLWDGAKNWKVGPLTAEQRKYPFEEIWSYPLLIDKIRSGWIPETDPR